MRDAAVCHWHIVTGATCDNEGGELCASVRSAYAVRADQPKPVDFRVCIPEGSLGTASRKILSYISYILSYIIKNVGGYKTNTLPDWLPTTNSRSRWFLAPFAPSRRHLATGSRIIDHPVLGIIGCTLRSPRPPSRNIPLAFPTVPRVGE